MGGLERLVRAYRAAARGEVPAAPGVGLNCGARRSPCKAPGSGCPRPGRSANRVLAPRRTSSENLAAPNRTELEAVRTPPRHGPESKRRDARRGSRDAEAAAAVSLPHGAHRLRAPQRPGGREARRDGCRGSPRAGNGETGHGEGGGTEERKVPGAPGTATFHALRPQQGYSGRATSSAHERAVTSATRPSPARGLVWVSQGSAPSPGLGLGGRRGG
jgi:hypothetical protein